MTLEPAATRPTDETTAFARGAAEPEDPGADVTAVPALGHETLAPVRELIESDAVEVVSTDIFDTLVWRRTLNPTDVFVELGQRLAAKGMLAPSFNPGAFARLRRFAEERTRADRKEAFGDSEVRLGEIYEALPDWVFDGRPHEEALVEELELELEIVVPDLDVVELLAHAASSGKTIVAISDIYFSADQLRHLLSQPELGSLPFRRIFSSSDYREGKAGKLFDIALASLGCEPVQMVHLGDNPGADIRPAEERGIRTVYLEKRSSAFEALLDREAMFGRRTVDRKAIEPNRTTSEAAVDFGLTALRAKTEHRAEGRRMPSGLRAHWRFGATVLGPALAGFGEWVHDEARALGADRVHCLMREGEFMTDFINGAAAPTGWPVGAERLWLSRYVATRAAIGDANERELERLMFGPTPPTVEQFCRRLGLGVNEIAPLAGHADTLLHDPIIRRLVLDALLEDDPLRGRIVEAARQLRDRLIGPLLASAPGDAPIVLVDIGWGATIQQRLTEALRHAGVEREVAGLYLMTNDVAGLAVTRGHRVAGFLMNCGFPDQLSATVMRAPEIIEQSLMPDFGTQIGIDENLQPIVAQTTIPPQQISEAAAVRRGALAFQRDYVRYRTVLPGKIISLAEAGDALAAVLTRAVVAPSAEEVTAFEGWVHDENFGSRDFAPLIDQNWSEKVRYLTPKQLAEQPMDQMYWPFGVAHRYDESLGDLAAAVAAGQLSWDATCSPLETGDIEARATAGVGIDKASVELTPFRNRHGLSFVYGHLGAHQIQRVEFLFARVAGVFRIDWFEFRLFPQGEPEPIVIHLEGSAAIGSLVAANCLVLPASLLVCTGSPALLAFDVGAITPRVVSRVEFEMGFAAIAGGPVLPGASRLDDIARNSARYERLQRTRAWRVAKPLRDVSKRVLIASRRRH